MVEADANDVVNSRTAEDVEETATELDSTGDGHVVGVAADMSDTEDIERLVETAVDEFGTIDLVVNNAAVWPMEESMLDASLSD